MRVLITVGFLGRNGETDGVATTYRHLIPFFERSGLAVDIVAYGPEDGVEERNGVRLFTHRPRLPLQVDPRRRIDVAFAGTRLARTLASEPVTLVQSSVPDPMGVWAGTVARRWRAPFVTLYHTALEDYAGIRARRRAGPVAGRAARGAMAWWLRRYFDSSDLVLAPARCVAEDLTRWLRPPAGVLGRGVDSEAFHPRKRRREGGRVRALYVGRVVPEKNLDLLVDVFAERTDVDLSIVGDGTALEAVRARLPRAVVPGRVVGEALAQTYADADFFVFPSRTDTLGNVVLEAMASGLPAVVTDDMGPKELVEPGRTGFVAHTDADFADAVDRLVEDVDRRRSMGAAARRFAETRSWEAIFGQLLQYYERVLAERRPAGRVSVSPGQASRPLPPREGARGPVPPRARSGRRPLCVLDITEFFGETSGGVKTYLTQKASFVGRHSDLRQVVIVPGERDDVLVQDGVRWYRVRGPRIPRLRPYRLLIDAPAIGRIIEAERPDIIELGSHFTVPWLVAGAAGATRTPVVWFCHSNLPQILDPYPGSGSWPRRLASALSRRYVSHLSRSCRATLAPSDSLADDLEGLGALNVARVTLGVDVSRFDPSLRSPRAVTRHRRRLPPTEPIVLYAGRVTSEKGVDLLLDAWPSIEGATGAHLVVVGEGPAKSRLMTRTDGCRIHWLPYEADREKLADLMAAADLYVAPSVVETFGLAALEAMACDTPVLSANRGAVAEHVVRSGAGALFTAGSAGSLVTRAVDLLTARRRPAGGRGHAYVSSHLSWSAAFERIFGVYEEVLRAAPAA